MPVASIIQNIKENHCEFVDLRFTDTRGKEHHITVPAASIDESTFSEGKAFDGSSFEGWQSIENSDMLLMPDPDSFVMDPFRKRVTSILRCTVYDPRRKQPYEFGPRSTALRAEAYLKSTGLADSAIFGPENEFFIFDKVHFETKMNSCFYSVDSGEAAWNSGNQEDYDGLGYHTRIKGGYFPVPPVDSNADLRSEICHYLQQIGIPVEVHHHEVATGGQSEIVTKFDTLVKKADQIQIIKYVAHNVAHQNGKTITFMPKPLVGDNGSGMHCHQSLMLNGKNIFSGNIYAGLSQTALYYIGGIIKHGKALNAFTNASTNSYRRLVPGFEAPIYLSYSSQNRSAAIRIPHFLNPQATRIEVRFPDATMNPYLGFSAMLMAGLDGIRNKIDPGAAVDKNLYELPKAESKKIPAVCYSLANALEYLDQDHDFLIEGGVFTPAEIERYIHLKMQDVTRSRMSTHPVELEMYYDL